MKKKHIVLVLLSLCLGGCIVHNGNLQLTETQDHQEIPLDAPSSTIISTPTMPITIEVTAQDTDIPSGGIVENCPSMASLDSGFIFPGRLVFIGSDADEYLAIEAGESEPTPFADLSSSLYISPTGKYLSIQNDETPQIITITDPLGKPLESMTMAEEQKNFIDRWFTDDWLRVISPDVQPFGLKLLSPWTGQINLTDPELPDAYLPSDDYYARAIYSPDLTRVIYTHLSRESYIMQFVLWDLGVGEPLWSSNHDIEITHAMYTFPAWSKDGSKFAITDQYKSDIPEEHQDLQDIFIISKDGEVLLSTKFRERFSKHWISQQVTWSPDNQYIAFWVLPLQIPSDQRLYRLFIMNVNSGKVNDLCIENGRIPEVAWSPGSDHLAAITGTPNDTHLIVIDIVQSRSFIILPDDIIPHLIGWME